MHINYVNDFKDYFPTCWMKDNPVSLRFQTYYREVYLREKKPDNVANYGGVDPNGKGVFYCPTAKEHGIMDSKTLPSDYGWNYQVIRIRLETADRYKMNAMKPGTLLQTDGGSGAVPPNSNEYQLTPYTVRVRTAPRHSNGANFLFIEGNVQYYKYREFSFLQSKKTDPFRAVP